MTERLGTVGPLIHDNNVETEAVREMVMSLLKCAGLGEGALEGVVSSGDMAVTQHAGTPGMSVDVAAGRCFVKGKQTNFQGTYHTSNDAAKTLTIASSNPTNPRIDIVCVTVRDKGYPSYTNDDWLIQVVTGTPASSPVAPSTPQDSYVLAQVAVAANASSIVNANITDLRARAGVNRYHASAHGNVAQNDSGGVNAILDLNVEDYDPSNSFNPSTFTYTCPVAGIYLVTGGFQCGNWSTDNGDRGLYLYKNGSQYRHLSNDTNQQASSAGNEGPCGTTTVLCNAGDTLALYYSTAGGISGNVVNPYGDFIFLGPL